MILLLLAWLLLYHGVLLWLALRFKDKPWRRWWFWGVLTLGLAFGWFDQIFLSMRIQSDWCQQAQVGFRELTSVRLSGRDVTWLPLDEQGLISAAGKAKIIERWEPADGSGGMTSNYMFCRKVSSRQYEPCVVSGYSFKMEKRDVTLAGRSIATRERFLLLKDGAPLRDSVNYRWGGGWFLDRVAGPDRRPFSCIDSDLYIATRKLTLED